MKKGGAREETAKRQGGRKILIIANEISLSLQLPNKCLVEVGGKGFAHRHGCGGGLRHLEQEAETVPKLKCSGGRVSGHEQL